MCSRYESRGGGFRSDDEFISIVLRTPAMNAGAQPASWSFCADFGSFCQFLVMGRFSKKESCVEPWLV